MSSIKKEYKLSVSYNGGCYAVMAHSIEKDESIYVRSRKRNNTALACSGNLIYADSMLKIDRHSVAASVGNQLHYHPTGQVNRKENNLLIKRDRFNPLINLSAPLLLFRISPASIAWFDKGKNKQNETVLDISEIQFKRLDFQIWIGPKMSFAAGFRPENTYASILFDDGILYDVVYFIREMDTLEDSLAKTTITAFPETNLSYSKMPPPEKWVGGLALAKQVAFFMNKISECNSVELQALPLLPKLFSVGHHTRMTICSNGIVAAVGPMLNTDRAAGSLEWVHFNIAVEEVAELLINRPEDNHFIDIGEHNKTFASKKTIFLRKVEPIADKMKHEMVVIARENNNGYYRLPDGFTSEAAKIITTWVDEIRLHQQLAAAQQG